jgi:hypothetical protein
MPCTICSHPRRQDIDLALLNRTATLTQLSTQHGLSTSALSRHKLHLLKKMDQAKSRFQDMLREGYLFILNKSLEKVWWAVQTAEAAGDSRQLLQGVRQATDILKFMAKLDGAFTADTVHRLLASTQWAEAGSLLPTDPQFVAGCHQALADSLFAPCPESAPGLEEALAVGQLDDADLAELAKLHPELLQELVAALPQREGSCACGPNPVKREKGGKKAGKTPSWNDNTQKNQLDSKHQKSPEKIPGQLLVTRNPKFETPLFGSGNWVEDLDAGRINSDLLNAIGAGRHPDLALTSSSVL